MSKLAHFQRVLEGANDVYHLQNLAPWIEKSLYVDGELMSMHGKYSFQADIVNDTSRVNNTVKPAQIGLTLTTIAYYLAGMATQTTFNVIYCLPTAGDAAKLTTTKVNPMIANSPVVRNLLNGDVNSNELKQIGNNFLFIRGSRSETAALSVSADCLVADEIDRCDPDTLKQFRSRLQASKLGIVRQFSTPTIEGVGISKEAETSKRYRHMAKCDCCSHTWLPSYHSDMVIPGYDRDLSELTKYNIKDVQWQDAYWKCPSCGRDPRFDPKNLQWVLENLQDNYEAHTYYVSPITACQLLLPAYLVRTSTEFNTRAEWQNQVLGETAEDTNEQLTKVDIERCMVQADLSSSEVHFLGADMGLLCAVTVGRMTATGELLVVHREMVPLGKFEERRRELIMQYRVIISVHDVYPYTSMIMSICDWDPNAWGCIFSTAKTPEMYTLQRKVENAEEGKLNLNLVKSNRTASLDSLRDLIKAGKVFVTKQNDVEDSRLMEHMLSLKRTQVFQGDELQFIWQKSDGNDHMMFSMLYLYLACKLQGTATGNDWGGSSLVKKFTLKMK